MKRRYARDTTGPDSVGTRESTRSTLSVLVQRVPLTPSEDAKFVFGDGA